MRLFSSKYCLRYLYCTLIIFLLSGCSTIFQASTNLNSKESIVGFDERALLYISYYNQYARHQIQDINMTNLRNSYRYTPWFSISLTPAHSLLWARLNQFTASYEIDKCIEVIEQHIAHYFADLYLHNYASFCYGRNNQLDLAEIHSQITTNLLYSILATGDGLTLETAYQVINSAEIISFLQLTDIELIDLKVVNDILDQASETDSTDILSTDQPTDDKGRVYFHFQANVIERATQEKIQLWFTMERPRTELQSELLNKFLNAYASLRIK